MNCRKLGWSSVLLLLITGCGTTGAVVGPVSPPVRNTAIAGITVHPSNQTQQIIAYRWMAGTKTLNVYLASVTTAHTAARNLSGPGKVNPQTGRMAGEEEVDLANLDGIVNYATATHSGVRLVRLLQAPAGVNSLGATDAGASLIGELPVVQEHVAEPSSRTVAAGIGGLPPGVRMDSGITPRAGLDASDNAKFQAILSVASSKIGTQYVWGHNEDRGQYGFDCSNFVEYVYHHALGEAFTNSSQLQNAGVGLRVPLADRRPGDLLCFNNGEHVGIYVGNDRMIQCGGGLGSVGYLSIGPGSYWGQHLTAVKRMF